MNIAYNVGETNGIEIPPPPGSYEKSRPSRFLNGAVIGALILSCFVGFVAGGVFFGLILDKQSTPQVLSSEVEKSTSTTDEEIAEVSPQTLPESSVEKSTSSTTIEEDLVAAEASASSATTSRTLPPSVSASTTTSSRPKVQQTERTAASPSSREAAPIDTSQTYAEQVLAATNVARADNGCPAVVINSQLSAAAKAHSEDMAANRYFDHTALDGSEPWDRAERAGYPSSYVAENIARGHRSAAAVVDGWMNSPGHRRNILTCDWTEMGLGFAEGFHWTQMFG